MKRNLLNKRVILYKRVSTTDQKLFGNSLTTQKNALRNFAEQNQMKVVKEFEEDYSAKNFNRPEFRKLSDYARKHHKEIDYILLTSWDRFARNQYEAHGVIYSMQELGIEINCIDNWIDYNDPAQVFSLGIYLGSAEMDNSIKSKKVKENMRQGLKEGRWNRAQPKGYIKGKDPENPKKPLMKPDPEIAFLITDLFKDYSLGIYSQNQLREMNKYQSLNLSKSNLSRMLSNPVYAGKILLESYQDEPEQHIDALHEPLIDWETFQKIQYQIGKRKRYKEKASKLNSNLPLRGFLKCPSCGGNLTGSPSKSKTGKLHYYYHCNPRKGCKVRFKIGDLHEKFDSFINTLQAPKPIIELFKEIIRNKYEKASNSKFKKLEKLQYEIENLESRKDKLLSKLLDGVVSDTIYQQTNKKMDSEIHLKKEKLEKLGNFQSELVEYTDFAVNLFMNFKVLFSNADISIKHKLLSSILDEKMVFDGTKYRTLKFKSGFEYIYHNINKLKEEEIKKGDSFSTISREVLEAGLEPARPQWSLDFKSNVSTNSTTRA